MHDKLGILVAVRPEDPQFQTGIDLADNALAAGQRVYFYCLDDAVFGVSDPRLQKLKHRGLPLFACAYAARKRGVPISDDAIFSGLSILNDMMVHCDRFAGYC